MSASSSIETTPVEYVERHGPHAVGPTQRRGAAGSQPGLLRPSLATMSTGICGAVQHLAPGALPSHAAPVTTGGGAGPPTAAAPRGDVLRRRESPGCDQASRVWRVRGDRAR